MRVTKRLDSTDITQLSDKQLNRIIDGLGMLMDEYPTDEPKKLVNRDDQVELAELLAMLKVLEG